MAKRDIPNLPVPVNECEETFEQGQARELEDEIQRESKNWTRANG